MPEPRSLAGALRGALPAALVALLLAAGAAAAQTDAAPAAPRQAVPGFDNRVIGTRDLPTEALRDARRRMLAEEAVSWSDLRGLADSGDGLAALRLAQRIEAEGDPALFGDAAHYYATAAYANRPQAVRPLVALLRRDGISYSPGRLRHIETSLRAMALSGDKAAAASLADLYASGRPFGPQPGRAFELRQELALAGDPEAAMAIVMEAVSGTAPVPVPHDRIEELLGVAAASGDLGLRATSETLGRLLASGAFDAHLAGADPQTSLPSPTEEATQ